MKRFTKTIIFALLLSVFPARIWAQDYTSNANTTQNVQIRDYENGFLFNVFQIDNIEERVQLASALATSDIWICNPTDNPGELYIRPNSFHADIPIYAEFDYLRMTLREEYEQASLLPKEEFAEIFNSWAHNISNDYYNFLIFFSFLVLAYLFSSKAFSYLIVVIHFEAQKHPLLNYLEILVY